MKRRGGEGPDSVSKGSEPAAVPSQPTPTPQQESLEDYPKAFADSDVMPWEQPLPKIVWPWGYERGRLLESIPSPELLRRRDQMAGLITEIDRILTERQGE